MKNQDENKNITSDEALIKSGRENRKKILTNFKEHVKIKKEMKHFKGKAYENFSIFSLCKKIYLEDYAPNESININPNKQLKFHDIINDVFKNSLISEYSNMDNFHNLQDKLYDYYIKFKKNENAFQIFRNDYELSSGYDTNDYNQMKSINEIEFDLILKSVKGERINKYLAQMKDDCFQYIKSFEIEKEKFYNLCFEITVSSKDILKGKIPQILKYAIWLNFLYDTYEIIKDPTNKEKSIEEKEIDKNKKEEDKTEEEKTEEDKKEEDKKEEEKTEEEKTEEEKTEEEKTEEEKTEEDKKKEEKKGEDKKKEEKKKEEKTEEEKTEEEKTEEEKTEEEKKEEDKKKEEKKGEDKKKEEKKGEGKNEEKQRKKEFKKEARSKINLGIGKINEEYDKTKKNKSSQEKTNIKNIPIPLKRGNEKNKINSNKEKSFEDLSKYYENKFKFIDLKKNTLLFVVSNGLKEEFLEMKKSLEKSKNMKIVQRLFEECEHRYNLYFNYMPFFQDEMKKEIVKGFNENEAIQDSKKTSEIMNGEIAILSNGKKEEKEKSKEEIKQNINAQNNKPKKEKEQSKGKENKKEEKNKLFDSFYFFIFCLFLFFSLFVIFTYFYNLNNNIKEINETLKIIQEKLTNLIMENMNLNKNMKE